jgi:Rrf2 family nitric oxide-sensitive transcriptional repressor
MHLTVHTRYALLALSHLAVNRRALIPISQIATTYGLSTNHLMKIVPVLRREGFVKAVRGRAGGLQLAREPEHIRIGDVVRLTERRFAAGHEANQGSFQGSVLDRALHALMTVLDSYTVKDMRTGNVSMADSLPRDF